MAIEKAFLKRFASALAYEETRCFYHSLDPRAKLLYLVASLAMASVGSITRLLAALGFAYALASPCPRALRKTLYVLTGLAPFIALTALFVVLFSVAFGGGSLSEVVLEQVKVFMRIAIVAVAVTAVALSTTPYEFVYAFVKMGFRYVYLYTLVIAVRFIPAVLNELSDIYDAQRSRGLELEKGGVLERFRRLNAIIVPAFVCSLLRARDLAEALELRGFGYSSKRTFYRALEFRRRDLLFTTLAILSALAVYVLIPLGVA
jgi:energy-coupling factor transport system permease protein